MHQNSNKIFDCFAERHTFGHGNYDAERNRWLKGKALVSSTVMPHGFWQKSVPFMVADHMHGSIEVTYFTDDLRVEVAAGEDILFTRSEIAVF